MSARADKPFEARLYALLNRPTHAKYQLSNGDYSPRTSVELRHFKAHFRDDDTIAVSAVDGAKANFLAIDIDADFERRLPIVGEVLKARSLDRAAFATEGSRAGRGKVIITLAEQLPQRQAVRLVQSLASDVMAHARFGTYKSSDISAYPTNGDGGHVRILGRHRSRGCASELPLDLRGEFTDLYAVEPANIQSEAPGVVGSSREFSAFATTLMTEPFAGSTPELFRAQCILAREVVEMYGPSGAADFLKDAFSKIEERSERISLSSRRNLKRSDVLQQVIKYATKHKPSDGHHTFYDLVWCPRKNIDDAPRPALRVYNALAQYVQEWRLDPACLCIDYGRIADLAGYANKSKVSGALKKAVELGLMVVLDRGLPHVEGRGGLPGIYALVGESETPAQAQAKGLDSAAYRQRLLERQRRGLSQTAVPETVAA